MNIEIATDKEMIITYAMIALLCVAFFSIGYGYAV